MKKNFIYIQNRNSLNVLNLNYTVHINKICYNNSLNILVILFIWAYVSIYNKEPNTHPRGTHLSRTLYNNHKYARILIGFPILKNESM